MQHIKKAKIMFSPSNVDHYERLFMHEHDVAMGYRPPTSPRMPSIIEQANEAFPVPPNIHRTFRAWIDQNQNARFDCFREPSWLCTCYKCVRFQLSAERDIVFYERVKDDKERAETYVATGTNNNVEMNINPEQDIIYFENIKDEKERVDMFADYRGCTATERLGFADPDERMQMLADMAARAGVESGAQNVVPPSVFGSVSCVCHFFTELNLEDTDSPKTPKITTIQVNTDVDSDHGKEQAQQAWIRRVRMTPTMLRF